MRRGGSGGEGPGHHGPASGVGAWMPTEFNDYKDITHFGNFEIFNDINLLAYPCTNAVALNILHANGIQNISMALYANAVSFDQLLALGIA